mmetsp:Transcript_39681/g.68004  ORF Transcript_39681/g.68004 Transcript_39681/m.68004 type:complete len:231 (+) Transcript_39681:1338-2030(+)
MPDQLRARLSRCAVEKHDASVDATGDGKRLRRVHADADGAGGVNGLRGLLAERDELLGPELSRRRLALLTPLGQRFRSRREHRLQLGGHAVGVDSHSLRPRLGRTVARGRRPRRAGLRLGQGLARVVPLLDQPRDHAASCVVLVEGLGKLLPQVLVLLLQRVGLQHQSVPLVLEQIKHARDAGGRHRPRLHCRAHLERQQVRRLQRVAGDRALAGALDVLFHNRPLEQVA